MDITGGTPSEASPDVEITLVESPLSIHSDSSEAIITVGASTPDNQDLCEKDSSVLIETSQSNSDSPLTSTSHQDETNSCGLVENASANHGSCSSTLPSFGVQSTNISFVQSQSVMQNQIVVDVDSEIPTKRIKTMHVVSESSSLSQDIQMSGQEEQNLQTTKDVKCLKETVDADCTVVQLSQTSQSVSGTFIGPVCPQYQSATANPSELPLPTAAAATENVQIMALAQPQQHTENEETQEKIFKLESQPNMMAVANADFDDAENFLRGCKWSPDGSCILTNSNDNILRIFDTPGIVYGNSEEKEPSFSAVVSMKECSTVYDFCWYPKMNSTDPSTCRLVSSAKDNSVHMWDAYSGEITCSYRAYNHLDEIVGPHSLAFNVKGDKLLCGFNKVIRVFDTARPGRECVARPTFDKTMGQRGIISCIAPCPVGNDLYAAGSFSKSVALYSEKQGDMLCMFEGQQGGITHIQFSPDGNQLYSGGRMDPEIICWDLRKPGHILFVALRQVLTHQRMYFDLDKSGRFLVSGSHDGKVYAWDTSVPPVDQFQGSDAVLLQQLQFTAHADTVNGVSFHPDLPFIATASGRRHYSNDVAEFYSGDESEEEEHDIEEITENSLKIWKLE